MEKVSKFFLNNGLKVIHFHDENTPMAVVNTLYDVGARDESPERTGFAHLFEHLMFGGSVNIPDFDKPLQKAGGESNAFTSNDITNYYDVLPVQNIETALWLESDRMLSLAFTEKSLEVQRQVVIEEFKQRYLNQPYGDVWLELRPMVYKTHPYQWATIGKNIEQIETASMDDVKAFFYKHYSPVNATLVIAGNIELNLARDIVEKWYGDIPPGEKFVRNLQKEPQQLEKREKDIERDVPADAFYYAYRMCDRLNKEYYAADLVSDLLGRGASSKLYDRLVRKEQICSEINAYIMGSRDDGMFVISGKISEKGTFSSVETSVAEILDEISEKVTDEYELQKVKNKWKTAKVFGEISALDKSMNLAYYEWLGDYKMIDSEVMMYDSVQPEDIQNFSKKTFVSTNVSILRVHKKNGK